MSRLHDAWEKIPLQGNLQLISADEVRRLTGKEPRLMMKFDHLDALPPVLKDSGRFILPLKNGLYAVIKGEGYHRLEMCGEVQQFARKTHFELKTTSTGISEMQHLDIAFNTGLLGHFLEEDILYPTIRGRKRSPNFKMSVAEHQLEVKGVQVEIDGGFEARKSVTLVEAKIGDKTDFHLRQLYYPFRFWSAHTEKVIRPVFFTYEPETEIYRFREYRFAPARCYAAPHLVKAGAYRIVESGEADFLPLATRTDVPFPQADRLDKIALIPFLAAEGLTRAEQLADILEFSNRQGRYYQDACKALGLITSSGEIAEPGLAYISSPPEIRYRMLCRSILTLPIMQEIITNLLLAPKRTLSKSQLVAVVQKATSLAPTTAQRRSQTVWSWLTWVSRYTPALEVGCDELKLVSQKTPAIKSTRQLELF